MLHIHEFSELPLMLWRIGELKLGLRVPWGGEGAQSVFEKVVHALSSDGILIYFLRNFEKYYLRELTDSMQAHLLIGSAKIIINRYISDTCRS